MKRSSVYYISCRFLTLLTMLVGIAVALQAEVKPEEMLQKHLDSIGTEKARGEAKSRVVEGSAVYKLIVGGQW